VVQAGATKVGRIGPVYTPPYFRRHGYASAITAMVAQHLVDQGARVMLFTDASNLTSNAIYQAIGFRLIDELVDMRFEKR
jgi:predicted GNAT family acetyltransferase